MPRQLCRLSLAKIMCLVTLVSAFAGAGCNSSSSSTPPPPPPSASGAMFVTDFSNSSISAWGQGANCNCAPNLYIHGSTTGLSGASGIAADTGGNLYVANQRVGTVTKYPGSGNGNISPSFAIGGLNSPIGVAVDAAGKVYVANSASSGVGTMSVQVYPPGSTVPSQTISGSTTGLSTPGFVALDAANNIWVTNQTGNSIEEFGNSATGNVAPAALIAGSNTLLSRPQGIAFDAAGRLYVAINNALGFSDAVLIFSLPLTGNIAPTNILCGINTAVNNPTGVAVNAKGTLFVVNSAFGVTPGYVTIFASNNIGGGKSCTGPAPNAVVGGANSTLLNPAGIALH